MQLFSAPFVTRLFSLGMPTLESSPAASSQDVGGLDPYALPVPRAGCLHVAFGMGCFYCTEKLFRSRPGVVEVTNGYSTAWGLVPDFSLDDGRYGGGCMTNVAEGGGKSNEVTLVEYDPAVVPLHDLLYLFWTQQDHVGSSRTSPFGDGYRSEIVVTSGQCLDVAAASMEAYGQDVRQSEGEGARLLTELNGFGEGGRSFNAASRRQQDFFAQSGQRPFTGIRPLQLAHGTPHLDAMMARLR
eukprot:TRINITY_DN69278_c0_g1_i1.p1 TRINITY_DN69278_c0_g1~~TRINITY_DN69278_c0_g1_i1.p1  ORF type:complete len:242 (+),score=30.07 TRINITY_DN69278_c0_g1_i1:48-773(+)